MLEIFNKISENLPPQNAGTPCVPKPPPPVTPGLTQFDPFW